MSENEILNKTDENDQGNKRRKYSAIGYIAIVATLAIVLIVIIISCILRNRPVENLPDNMNIATIELSNDYRIARNRNVTET